MNNACIIGYGMVGKATAEVFGIEKHFDHNEEKSNISLEEASKCRLIFICLPTPVDKDGSYMLNDIKAMIKQIDQYGSGSIYVIRSTVAPGFAKALQEELGIATIISNPEFLSEDTAVQDMKNPPFIVIGGMEGVFRDEVKAFYDARIKGSEVIMTDNTTAEMMKLTLNSFFALKVIFANETYEACKMLGANYETVKKVLEKHPFGSKNHWVIWYKNKRGVNGHCLPKDSSAFFYYTGSVLMKAVKDLNALYSFLKNDE